MKLRKINTNKDLNNKLLSLLSFNEESNEARKLLDVLDYKVKIISKDLDYKTIINYKPKGNLGLINKHFILPIDQVRQNEKVKKILAAYAKK